MIEYKEYEKKRKTRQLIASVFFLLILIGGWFFPILGYFIPFCMLLGLGIGIFRGRKWCDWLCPRGSFYDCLVKPLSPEAAIPDFLKKRNLRIWLFSLLMLILASNIIARWPDVIEIGRFFVQMLTVTTALGVILALFFHQRLWCYLCPVGSLINWAGGKRQPLKIISRLCIECASCAKACPMQIAPIKYKKEGTQEIKERDCLKCNLCILICPKKALTRQRGV